jgi:hypothetical protein
MEGGLLQQFEAVEAAGSGGKVMTGGFPALAAETVDDISKLTHGTVAYA